MLSSLLAKPSPVPHGLLELLVVGMCITPGCIERTVPEMVGHQRNVPLLMPNARAGTVSEGVNPLEAHLRPAADALKAVINNLPTPTGEKVTLTFKHRNTLERLDKCLTQEHRPLFTPLTFF